MGPTNSLIAWWLDVWRGSPHSSDMPMQGEHRVARSRVILVATLTVVGFLVVLQDPSNEEYRRAIPVDLLCLAFALLVLYLTKDGTRPRGFGLATTVTDITAVTLLHVTDVLQHHPSVAVNGRVTFMAYFFALIGTCVRWDPRLPLIGGLVAAVQYLGVVTWSAAIWPAAATPDVAMYGSLDWGVQLERAVTLVLFALSCRAIAQWSVQVRASATHDALTNLINRRTFEERLHGEVLRASRLREPVSVAMVDIDHFKQINDEHGHEAGDAALREVARLISTAVRRTDLVARWGGEEFALAFPGAEAADAAFNVERLRQLIDQQEIVVPGGKTVHLTISAGIATSPSDGANATDLVRAADVRLFGAKRAGRNRLVTTPDIPAIIATT
ncbi:MAG: GGDEF domain-containing protein [Gemmatimonadaceae bacterium]